MTKKPKPKDQYSKAEAAKRRDDAVRAALNMAPRPHDEDLTGRAPPVRKLLSAKKPGK